MIPPIEVNPDVNEVEAVELAYTTIHCMNLEGKDRPIMADIVVNLERAVAICDSSRDSISVVLSLLFQNDIAQPRERGRKILKILRGNAYFPYGTNKVYKIVEND
ncbi:putative serine/threonine-protein kinase protein CCR3 [Spatholobus suberectus]|nr:putative serine/threonine-protein kinase protein CCR3 [Spatholobus suberectus]